MALFSLNELNHFRVKLARNYTIVPLEFSKIIIDKKACLQALKLNVQLLHLLQFGITGRPGCFRLKAAMRIADGHGATAGAFKIRSFPHFNFEDLFPLAK